MSESELTKFCELVRAGGEDESEGLERRVQQAKSLVFLKVDKQIVGVAAIKQPRNTYRDRVFRSAGVREAACQFQLELGYIFVKPEYRGQRYSYVLSVLAMSQADRKAIYATTRQNNLLMKKTLERLEFRCVGDSWQSDIDENNRLVLYVNTLP